VGETSEKTSSPVVIHIQDIHQNPEAQSNIEAALRSLMEAGRVDFARSNAEAALEIDATSLPAQIALGVVARHARDYQQAEQILASAHLQSPGNFAAINNLALTLVESPNAAQRQRALEFAQVNARLYGDIRQVSGREAAVTLAWALFQVGQQDDALRTLKAAGRAGTLTPESTYYAARILAAQDNPAGARGLLERVLRSRCGFVHREDAEALLKTLRAGGTGASRNEEPAHKKRS
jgi:tetratricopeptide (TPR) repeat protein